MYHKGEFVKRPEAETIEEGPSEAEQTARAIIDLIADRVKAFLDGEVDDFSGAIRDIEDHFGMTADQAGLILLSKTIH